jgi:CPA2 family monovalent cation:H+ antiporter-2
LVKSGVNVVILRLLGEPWPRAFVAGILLSQVGEFSFVLAGAGVAVAAVGIEGHRLIVAVIALSLMVSPLWLMTARRLQHLTAGGIWRLDDLLLGIYEKEARLFARGSISAARRSFDALHQLRARSWRTGELTTRLAAAKARAAAWRTRRQTGPAPINDDEVGPLQGEVLPPKRNAYKRRA